MSHLLQTCSLIWNENRLQKSGFLVTLAACSIALAASARDYPYYIPDDDSAREKFDILATEFGNRGAEGILEDAFLLDCSPDSVDAARAEFRVSRISETKAANGSSRPVTAERKKRSTMAMSTPTAMSGSTKSSSKEPATMPGSSGPD